MAYYATKRISNFKEINIRYHFPLINYKNIHTKIKNVKYTDVSYTISQKQNYCLPCSEVAFRKELN